MSDNTFKRGDFTYNASDYPDNHVVFTRIDETPATGPVEIRIVPVEKGVRVDFGANTGRIFHRIRNLTVVRNKPLYIAELLTDEINFWSNDVLVYGTTEFYGSEFVDEIVGVVDDCPIFCGHTIESGDEVWRMVIYGKHHGLGFAEVSERIAIHSKLPVYAARRMFPDDTWCAVFGCVEVGEFDCEPEIQCVEWANPMYDSEGHENGVEFRVTGRVGGEEVCQVIKLANLKQVMSRTFLGDDINAAPDTGENAT